MKITTSTNGISIEWAKEDAPAERELVTNAIHFALNALSLIECAAYYQTKKDKS